MNLDSQALPVTPLDLSFSFVMEGLGTLPVLLVPRNSRWTANGVPVLWTVGGLISLAVCS